MSFRRDAFFHLSEELLELRIFKGFKFGKIFFNHEC